MTYYERIGVGYAERRRPDPRIERRIFEALGDARSVVNVGAGTGSYEPSDRKVVAVELTAQMIEQRAADAAPVVQGRAEGLPFPDLAFDAAMAVLTVHHWADFERGIAEMRRVAHRQVFLGFDTTRQPDLWLLRGYIPAWGALEQNRAPTMDETLALLDSPNVEPVPVPWDCTDGFGGAYWRRPE